MSTKKESEASDDRYRYRLYAYFDETTDQKSIKKPWQSMIYAPEQTIASDLGDEVTIPAILLALGPYSEKDEIDYATAKAQQVFIYNNFKNIVGAVYGRPAEGDAVTTTNGYVYSYTENRDILEEFAEKLPSQYRRLMLSQDRLVGFIPARRLQ